MSKIVQTGQIAASDQFGCHIKWSINPGSICQAEQALFSPGLNHLDRRFACCLRTNPINVGPVLAAQRATPDWYPWTIVVSNELTASLAIVP